MRFVQGLRCLKICWVFFAAAVLVAPPAWADPAKIASAIDEASGSCRVVSQKIYDWKELGQEEFKSSALLME